MQPSGRRTSRLTRGCPYALFALRCLIRRPAGEGSPSDRLEHWTSAALQAPLTSPKNDRHDVQVQLIEAAGCEILPDGDGTTGDRHVLIAGDGSGLLQRGRYPVRDERELSAALHRQWLARVMGEHENRRMVWRLVAPPALPLLIPISGPTPKHLAAHDVGADTLGDLIGDVRVGIVQAAHLALLSAPAGRREHPLVKAHPALTGRVFNALIRPGAKAVQRDRDLARD